jgi:F0F1-type ATP synthase membrane subunit c/vacuolar-type H+-ATPase subunit K
MSAWLIAIIALSAVCGLGIAGVVMTKSLDQRSRLTWVVTIAVFETVVLFGLLAMWMLTGMG